MHVSGILSTERWVHDDVPRSTGRMRRLRPCGFDQRHHEVRHDVASPEQAAAALAAKRTGASSGTAAWKARFVHVAAARVRSSASGHARRFRCVSPGRACARRPVARTIKAAASTGGAHRGGRGNDADDENHGGVVGCGHVALPQSKNRSHAPVKASMCGCARVIARMAGRCRRAPSATVAVTSSSDRDAAAVLRGAPAAPGDPRSGIVRIVAG
jgi:hypothetical protein